MLHQALAHACVVEHSTDLRIVTLVKTRLLTWVRRHPAVLSVRGPVALLHRRGPGLCWPVARRWRVACRDAEIVAISAVPTSDHRLCETPPRFRQRRIGSSRQAHEGRAGRRKDAWTNPVKSWCYCARAPHLARCFFAVFKNVVLAMKPEHCRRGTEAQMKKLGAQTGMGLGHRAEDTPFCSWERLTRGSRVEAATTSRNLFEQRSHYSIMRRRTSTRRYTVVGTPQSKKQAP